MPYVKESDLRECLDVLEDAKEMEDIEDARRLINSVVNILEEYRGQKQEEE